MNILERIVNWLFENHEYGKVFSGSGFALIMVLVALGLVISCCVSKKVRNLFF